MKKRVLLGVVLFSLCGLCACAAEESPVRYVAESVETESGAERKEKKETQEETTPEVIQSEPREEKEYTWELVLEKTGLENYITSDLKFGDDLIADEYIPQGENDYSKYSFYLFDSVEQSKAAFDYMVKRWFNRDENFTVTDYTINGDEAGVTDASVQLFVYRSGNMIITYRDWTRGGEYDSEEEYYADQKRWEEEKEERESEAQKMHEFIMSEW